MRDYVDTEAMARAARTADSAADSMRQSASTAEDAAERMTRAAQQIGDAAARIGHLLEDGYGGNGLRLIELLDSTLTPRQVTACNHVWQTKPIVPGPASTPVVLECIHCKQSPANAEADEAGPHKLGTHQTEPLLSSQRA